MGQGGCLSARLRVLSASGLIGALRVLAAGRGAH
jgi:hypothetical protein